GAGSVAFGAGAGSALVAGAPCAGLDSGVAGAASFLHAPPPLWPSFCVSVGCAVPSFATQWWVWVVAFVADDPLPAAKADPARVSDETRARAILFMSLILLGWPGRRARGETIQTGGVVHETLELVRTRTVALVVDHPAGV